MSVIKLPESLQRKDMLDQLTTGESGYIMPYCMYVDNDRTCWLSPKEIIREQPSDAFLLKVTRSEEGFIVDVSNCTYYKWGVESSNCNFGKKGYLPVVKIEGF